MKPLAFFILAMLLVLPAIAASPRDAHMVLLAVKEDGSSYSGSTADLYLSISPGSGRVFIETSPLTKMDTQVSTTFAKNTVCSMFVDKCDDYDFFYTIRSGSAIVGGPSAGAASAVLTLALLDGLKVNQSVAMTGTINSGALVGPVGGISQKLEAASDSGIKTVLIPKGERFSTVSNKTVDLVEYGHDLGLEVIEVASISDAMPYFTGKSYAKPGSKVNIDHTYKSVMENLADRLCMRSANLSKMASGNESYISAAQNLTNQSRDAILKGSYYSAASFCFGASIDYTYAILLSQNYSDSEIRGLIYRAYNRTADFEKSLPPYKTLTDLQSYSIIMERLDEARDYLSGSLKLLDNSSRENALFSLSYAGERLYSAELWSTFLGKGDGSFDLSSDAMANSCRSKISEAEGRYEYAKLFIPEYLLDRTFLDKAYTELDNKRYEVCLFQASKATAGINAILGLLGVEEKSVPDIISEKLSAAKESIIRQSEKGLFPIAGYSYYEYAISLKDSDLYSALLYSEYSLELSNLDVYLERKSAPEWLSIGQVLFVLAFLALGIVIGFSLAVFVSKHWKRKRRILLKSK